MPRADDRVARALARTQELLLMGDETREESKSPRNLAQIPSKRSPSPKRAPSSRSPERKSTKSVSKSERIIINNQEMDIDKVVQKVRERLSSPRKSPKPPSESTRPEVPSPRNVSVKTSPRANYQTEQYIERDSPRSPYMVRRMPVTEVATVEIIPEPIEKKVSATTLSYGELKRSTRDELDSKLRSMNSQQLREEILKLRSEKTSVQKSNSIRQQPPQVYYDKTIYSAREENIHDEKIPIYDEERGTYVLWSKSKLSQYTQPTQQPQAQYVPIAASTVKPPLYRRGTTRDAYPTKTYDPENYTYEPEIQQQPNIDIVAVNDQIVEESTDIDFDGMTEIQKREFLNEMKMKFAVFKKNYPNFPIPAIQDDDNPKWVFGIYEQLLDMAKSDASQPIYQTGLQVVFLILQVVLTVSGVPAKNFFSFHAKNFAKYNTLMAELGEKWGPIIDVTSSVETKLALAIGWNTLVYAIVSVVASKFGDRWGTSVEQMLDKLTTSTANNSKMEELERELSGRAEMPNEPAQDSNNTGGDALGGLANMLGGLFGGGGGNGGGAGNLIGNLLGAFTGGGGGAGNQGTATSTERRPPTYDD